MVAPETGTSRHPPSRIPKAIPTAAMPRRRVSMGDSGLTYSTLYICSIVAKPFAAVCMVPAAWPADNKQHVTSCVHTAHNFASTHLQEGLGAE